jgi:hypothetical protein|tara:strand:+ start:83 stop:268 length:186 start_codon:yes stop_codon:yes gene_type:complete
MENPEENKTQKPSIILPLTAVECSQILDGQEFTWECKETTKGEKVVIKVYLDKMGTFLTEE